MPQLQHGSIDAAPTEYPWIPASKLGPAVRPSGVELESSYTTDTKTLAEADWVYLQVVMAAHQVHPATVAELALLGPVGGANAKRWTIEGPLMHRPGDPGAVFGNDAPQCTALVEVAHSLTADPGTNWRRYVPGRYRLRSVQARVTITRPDPSYSFALTRLAIMATRIAPPARPRRVQGVQDVIPSGTCRVVSRDFTIVGAGSLVIEADGYLQIL